MNNKSIQFRILLIIVLLGVAISIVFATKYRGTKASEVPSQPITEGVPAGNNPAELSPSKSLEPEIASHTDSYITGFEHDMLRVTYEFKYKPHLVALQSLGPKIFLRDLETKQTNTITIFYNGAAGFTSSQHFWEEMQLCADCKRINPTLDFGESKDLIMYSNGQKEWAVFERPPGFVVAEFFAGRGEVKTVIASMNLTLVPAAPGIPETDTVKLFFFDKTTSETGGCTSTVSVTRSIQKTPKIATATILELLEGPSFDEEHGGLFSLVPASAWLNALTIEHGEAVVNISDDVEKNGNACRMEGIAAQIRQTLLQFPTVKKVRLLVDGREEILFGN